ncbi:hypothetical protein JKG47_09380 [Acidithiobacillus sp. MC6.1]|nr:hypothetical protein [Acidithiobacillus sp. MC6.1]
MSNTDLTTEEMDMAPVAEGPVMEEEDVYTEWDASMDLLKPDDHLDGEPFHTGESLAECQQLSTELGVI